jgi:hypothetical protein
MTVMNRIERPAINSYASPQTFLAFDPKIMRVTADRLSDFGRRFFINPLSLLSSQLIQPSLDRA